MDDNYRIKKVGDGWEFLPREERDRKRKYENLTIKIRRREKKIERIKVQLKKEKEELREWKGEMRKGYNEMVKYHKTLTPTFSTSISKNPKNKQKDNLSGNFKTRGNRSWTITVRVVGKRKPIYLGTMEKVGEMIDLIEGKSEFWSKKRVDTNYKHEVQTIKKIEELVYPLIKRDLIKCLESEGSLEPFMNSTVKGMDYLNELYLNSEFYEEPKVIEKKESKGFFLGYLPNGEPIYGKKKSKKEKGDKEGK